jgi:hypothetical protein
LNFHTLAKLAATEPSTPNGSSLPIRAVRPTIPGAHDDF